ncbi:MAG: helix-turn-helix domain-containing protein [bacterium]
MTSFNPIELGSIDRFVITGTNMPARQKTSSATPVIKLHLALPFIETLDTRKINCSEVLSRFDLTPAQMHDQSMLVSANTMYRLLDGLAAQADDPALAIMIGEQLDLAHWPLFEDATKNATTVGDFFLQFIAKTRDVASGIEYGLDVRADQASFRLFRAGDPGFCPQQADSFYVGLFYNIFSKLLGDAWDAREVSMQVCDPTVVPQNYHNIRVYKCESTGFRMLFPATWLLQPIRVQSSEHPQLASAQNIPPTELLQALSELLKPHLHLRELDTARAAEFCGYAPRSLARRLREQGTSVTKLIAQLRKEEATQLLLETDLPITEVALAVGFPEPSGFTRSFKKWTGLTPRDYRKKNDRVNAEPKLLIKPLRLSLANASLTTEHQQTPIQQYLLVRIR